MYWTCARLQANRERLALSCLGLAGYTTYCPRILERRRSAPLFPGYAFVAIELQWHQVNNTPGVIRLIRDGDVPARVPDAVIDRIRAQERGGYVALPKMKMNELERGDRVAITAGSFDGHIGIYQEMRPHQRVAVLLTLFGGQQRVELARGSIRPVA
jgi:transcriptional antiterminator RfaH